MNELASLGPYAFVQPTARRLLLARDLRGQGQAVVLERVVELPRGDEASMRPLLSELEKMALSPLPSHLTPLSAGVFSSGAAVELCLVHPFRRGFLLSSLLEAARRRCEAVPVDVAVAIALGALRAQNLLHTSNLRELRTASGQPFGLSHRQLVPRWVLVGEGGEVELGGLAEGLATWPWARLKERHLESLRYAAPEQVRGGAWSPRVDAFRAAAILWEMLADRPRVEGRDLLGMVGRVMMEAPTPPSRFRSDIPPALDALLLRALARRPDERFEGPSALAAALAGASPPATPAAVARWAAALGAEPFPGPEVYTLSAAPAAPEASPESEDAPADRGFYR